MKDVELFVVDHSDAGIPAANFSEVRRSNAPLVSKVAVILFPVDAEFIFVASCNHFGDDVVVVEECVMCHLGPRDRVCAVGECEDTETAGGVRRVGQTSSHVGQVGRIGVFEDDDAATTVATIGVVRSRSFC